MDEVALDLDVATVEDMRREAEEHGFDALDGYVQWVLERRETVLAEHDTPEFAPETDSGAEAESDAGEWETLDEGEAGDADAEADDPESEEEVELPDEDGADDDDVAAALEEIELDEEEES